MSEREVMLRLELVRPRTFCERTADLPDAPDADIQIGYTPSYALAFDEEAGRVQIGVYLAAAKVQQDDEEPEEEAVPLLEVEVVCLFAFESLDPFRKEGAVQIPRPLLAHLVGMTLSTIRGIMVGRAKHPIFQRAPLPIVSPVDFIDGLVEGLEWVAPAE